MHGRRYEHAAVLHALDGTAAIGTERRSGRSSSPPARGRPATPHAASPSPRRRGTGMVVGDAVDVVVERVERCRGRRSPPAASLRRRSASRAAPGPSTPEEPAIRAPSGQPRPFEKQSVTVSKAAADPCRVHAGRNRGVDEPSAVEVNSRGRAHGRLRRWHRPRRAARRGRPSCCACSRS